MSTATPQNLQDRYRALMEAAKGLIACTDLDSIVEHLLRHSIQMMQTETCSMYVPDPATKELIIYSARGEQDEAIHTVRIPWDKGIAGHVFQEKKTVRIDDVQNDPRFMRSMDKKTGFVTRAMICMPLLEREHCLGVIQGINPIHTPTFTDLDQEIFEGLAGLVTSAFVRLERERLRADESRMQRELTLAHEIQKSFLPPQSTTLPRAELHVHYQAARTLGGDFYAVIPLANHAVLFAVGDVSGKGIPAALTTAQVIGELSALATLSQRNLTDLVNTLNHNLCSRLSSGRFVATTFLLYEPESEQMEILCAGQFSPWRWEGQSWKHQSIASALPLGVFANYHYQSTKVPCLPGERWILCSDGINEGRNLAEEEYGFERLVSSMGLGLPGIVLEHAWNTWHQFVDSENLHDDACLGILACTPPHHMKVSSEPKNCKIVRSFVEGWCMHAGLPDLDRGQIVLAFDEAFTNVLRHAYEGKPGQPIEISAAIEENKLNFRMRDFGKQFKVESLPERNPSELRPGGMGLLILRQTFSIVDHQSQEPGTELLLSADLVGRA